MRDPIRRSRLAIHDMLDTIEKARAIVAGLSVKDIREDTVRRFAAERSVEIVSEAARRISDDLIEGEPTILWPKVRGIGNVLRHEYDEVAPEAIRNVIENDFAPLEVALRRMRDDRRRMTN